VPVADAPGGGALVDAHGAVVGMTSAVASEDGLETAIPIDVVHRVAEDLIAHGRARHVWLGVEGSDVDLPAAKDLDIAGGAMIERVVDDSPAALAGVAAGDVVVEVDGEPVGSMSDLIAALRLHEPGEVVVLSVRRGNETVLVQLTLGERA
jgi:S1-C subfamily serine protease